MYMYVCVKGVCRDMSVRVCVCVGVWVCVDVWVWGGGGAWIKTNQKVRNITLAVGEKLCLVI